jgi:hypothetical protein
MYDGSGYGPTFGGGHDLYISSNSNNNSWNYTNTPHSYDTLSNTTLFGSYQFQTNEIEVFKVI